MELATEREMRINLEVNIENIVMNFKRFYVEADNARKIVVQKLKEIEARDADINSKLEILSSK